MRDFKKALYRAAAFLVLLSVTAPEMSCNPDKPYQSLNYANVVDMGEVHNEMILRIHKRYNDQLTTVRAGGDLTPFMRQVCIDELRATPIDVAPMGITREQFDQIFIGLMDDIAAHDMDIRNMPGSYTDPGVEPYANEIINAAELRDPQEKRSAIAAIRARAATELGESRANDEVQMIAEIADGSVRLWTGDEYPVATLNKAWAGKVIAADCGAAAGAFLRMGIVGCIFASTPPANAVIAANLAIGIGISSGFAGLMYSSDRVDLKPSSPE